MKKDRRIFGKIIILTIMLFFYLPIAYVMVFSFNSSKSLTSFSGFSLEWYKRMLDNSDMMIAFYTTIGVAIIATVVSTFVGTISAIGISKSRKVVKRAIGQINDLPIMNPEIVTAIGLMLLFITFKVEKGLITMILAHISFCTPYVILSVMPKLVSLDDNLAEAAMDLGASPWQAIRKVIVPQIKPGIIAGSLIAFTMSIDDFIISYFVSGKGVKNLSMVVYTMSKRVNPSINAISAVVVVLVTLGLIIVNLYPLLKKKIIYNKGGNDEFVSVSKKAKFFRILAPAMAVVLVLATIFGSQFIGGKSKSFVGKTLHLYNWGQYIDPELLSKFEDETGAKVIMDTFDSNEQMYIKLVNGDRYDVVVPSDYMIQRLIQEDMLLKLDVNKKKEIIDRLHSAVKKLPYDKDNEYSIPFFWGSVGIIYDKNKVSEEELEEKGFAIFQDKKYRGETYLYDSERDSFMMALKDLGYSMNTKNQQELQEAYEWLIKSIENTKPEIVTDEIIDNMAQGRKALGIIYSGDAAYVMSENEDMGFFMPKSGTNLWSDAMVIPKNAREPELAMEFMLFMTKYENSLQNSTFVGYTASNEEVFDYLSGEGDFKDINAYVPRENYIKDEVFSFDDENRKIIANLWSKVKIFAATE